MTYNIRYFKGTIKKLGSHARPTYQHQKGRKHLVSARPLQKKHLAPFL